LSSGVASRGALRVGPQPAYGQQQRQRGQRQIQVKNRPPRQLVDNQAAQGRRQCGRQEAHQHDHGRQARPLGRAVQSVGHALAQRDQQAAAQAL